MFPIFKMSYLLLTVILFSTLNIIIAKTNLQSSVVIDNISDIKEFKKLLRTKTNMLILFVSNSKEAQTVINVFHEAAEAVKGFGTMVLLDCSNSDKKKLCKKTKVSPTPFVLRHYKDGEFHKVYDRQISVTSMVNFMRDPTGDLPWEEDPNGADVIHIQDINMLSKIVKKESKPLMIMFYAPWCGFCKQLKPEYAAAASESKNKYVFAAIDVDRPENSIARRQYNITGFPTLLYFENGKMKHIYDGENKKSALLTFMENPSSPSITKPKDDDWSADTSSEIVHLTTKGFEPALKDEKSVLVMFYAPWCGHCKKLKPEYEKASLIMKNEKIPGILAALDATKEKEIAQKYGIKGYPVLKYFINGEYKFDVNVRDFEKIIEFMKNPKEPPPPPPPEKPWEEEINEIVHLNDEIFKSFLKKKKHALVIFYAPWCGHCKNAKPEFSAAANTFKDDPRVAFAAVDCTRYTGICKQYNIQGYPTFKYFSYLKTVTDYTGGRTKIDFVNFISNFKVTNKVQFNEDQKTQKLLEKYPGYEHVLILNDNNIEKETKLINNLLILFYTSLCNDCELLKKEFALAAKTLEETKTKNIRLGIIDCDENHKSLDKFKINKFPTILLFENGKYVKKYDGAQKAENLLEFLKNNKVKTEL